MKAIAILPILLLSLCSVVAQPIVPPPVITVLGSAEIKVAPDEILLSVGVETRDENLDAAVTQHNEHMTRALEFLKTSGIQSKHIQTDCINITPEFDSNVSRTKPVVFVVRKSIEVRLDTPTDLEPILTGLLTNGVNHVHGIDFRTSRLRRHRDQARAMAIRAAREKATALAQELGVRCGEPTAITSNDWGGGWTGMRRWQPFNSYGYYNAAQNAAESSSRVVDEGSSTLSIGQISVAASVTVTFKLLSE